MKDNQISNLFLDDSDLKDLILPGDFSETDLIGMLEAGWYQSFI